jgi:hypothetical protein
MKKTELFYITIIITLLSIQPLLASPVQVTFKTQTHSLSLHIANKLYKRGLDAKVAQQKAYDFLNTQGDSFVEILVLLQSSFDIQYDAMVAYLANMALVQKHCNIQSYSSLVAMVQRIKGVALSKQELAGI